jgi:hypothetical protein
VEQVAVNAVMVGARPEHFPVILAIASTEVTSLWSSCTSQVRMVIVNGPIRKEIKMNSGMGALGPFNEANAVIGRAWTLISKNLGQSGEPEVTYLGAIENSLNYNNLCFAENEERLPRGWKPVHVQKSYKPEDSAITVFFHNGSRVGMFGDASAAGILRGLCEDVKMTGCLVMAPGAARKLAEEGWTKKEVMTLIAEYAHTPAQLGGALEVFTPKEKMPLDSSWTMRPWGIETMLRIIVSGGNLDNNFIVSFGCVMSNYGNWVTKKVELPKNWPALVKKYKDIVPVYARY